ncbi:MAG: alpha-ketoacid dehydrogenase subunit beta [Gemmatimonadota bacterium]
MPADDGRAAGPASPEDGAESRARTPTAAGGTGASAVAPERATAEPVTYLEAIRAALREELRRDPDVFLIGEDIGEYGGAFKVTKGLLEEFGPKRIIDTPLAEAGFTGAAVGAALMGMRPVVEYQFADFVSCAFDQITNFAAKTHYRLGDPVPVTFRLPVGGRIHGGPFHSQNPEAYFLPTPGLKIVAPATASDAYGLLKAAIRDDDPVLFLEHKYLYRRIKERLPAEGDHVVPIGRAAVRARGDGATVLSYGAMVHVCLEAMASLPDDAVELVDLRTLLPLDETTILDSVRKTGKVLIVHEDNRTGGLGGELAALVGEKAFEWMDAPIRRVAAPDTPVPFSPPLEDFYMPDAAQVSEALDFLLAY